MAKDIWATQEPLTGATAGESAFRIIEDRKIGSPKRRFRWSYLKGEWQEYLTFYLKPEYEHEYWARRFRLNNMAYLNV